MILSMLLTALLPIVATTGLTAPASSSVALKLNSQISISSEIQPLALMPDAGAQVTVAAPSAPLAGPRLPSHQPLVANDAEGWFNKNAKTIAIVAVAVVVVLIITN